MSDATKMTPPPMSAGRLCVCRSGAFYAQSAYNVLICASVLWLHLFLFWLAFEVEHDATPVWRDFALSRNAFLGLATLAPILFYMLWVDGVLVPVFVVVWAALAPVGFNLQGSGDVLNPPSCLVLIMWPGKFLLGGSTVMAAFLFLSELSIALPFCLRYFFFGLPRELIACLRHGFLRLLSVVLRGCCCGGRGAYVRPPYSRLMGLEKRKIFSGNGASWVRCLDVDRYETEGSALPCCEERVGQGDGSYHGEVLRPVEGRKNSGHLTQSEYQDEAPEKSHHIEEKTPAVLGWVLWERLLREVVRRQDVFMYDSALRYSKTLESATKDTDLEMVPPKKADPVEGKGEPVFERLHSNMARVHRIDEQRRCEIKKRQLLAGNQCCAGSPSFCARMAEEDAPLQKLRTHLPLQNVELYSIASVSGPFGGSDFFVLLYRSFPKAVVKGIVDGWDALYVDLLPRSEQTANLSRTLARVVACRGETTHLRGGAHFFGGSADVLVYPYSAFGLMFPMDYPAASGGGVGEGQALENYPADVALDSVAENTSFALLTNLGHHNIAVSATLWRSVLSRVVREVQ
eukprot:g6907.t1